MWKKELKGGTDYICYQTIMRKNMRANVHEMECTARVQIDEHGNCRSKSIPHTKHNDHENLYEDLKSKNNFIDDVIAMSEMLVDLPTEVSSRDIFTRELAKWVQNY